MMWEVQYTATELPLGEEYRYCDYIAGDSEAEAKERLLRLNSRAGDGKPFYHLPAVKGIEIQSVTTVGGTSAGERVDCAESNLTPHKGKDAA